MFGKRFHLFTIFGFRVGVDASWFFLAIILTWSLATSAFPFMYERLPRIVYWWMGIAGALGLFASIVLHELAHSVIARHHGVVMRGITLFIFGGVAEMTDEPPGPKAEFQVAIAGPIASVLVALVCLLGKSAGNALGWSVAITGVLAYLAYINGILVAFNLIPAFPLDGGRVLRSILWNARNDLTWATKITANIGIGFAFILIAMGVVNVVSGRIVAGMWSFLIGLFLRGAAQMSYQQQLIRRSLEGEPVRRFMKTNPVTVSSGLTIASLVEDFIYNHHYKMYPVVDNDALVGCIGTREVKAIPREEWPQRTVREIAQPCTEENTIDAGDDATEALSKMSRFRLSRLMVTEGGRLVGIITLKDLLQFLSLKVELER